MRLPPARLNERVAAGSPLAAAFASIHPLPRTVKAILSRAPDVDLHDFPSYAWPQWATQHLFGELRQIVAIFSPPYLAQASAVFAQTFQEALGSRAPAAVIVNIPCLVAQYAGLFPIKRRAQAAVAAAVVVE
jgi:hypothetical protein